MYRYPNQYDVIVIGGGHAGVEAAGAAARMGANTLLITQSIDTIGVLSCNPAIGGLGKTHLVKEVDALDGFMAKAADASAIHKRLLNTSKGAAVQAVRSQACRDLYRQSIRSMVENTQNLTLFQSEVSNLMVKNDQVLGIITQMGVEIYAQAVVMTTGTFLAGKIHIGTTSSSGGRCGDGASDQLATYMGKVFQIGRLKTGTPPRIATQSIQFTSLPIQASEQNIEAMSFDPEVHNIPQMHCYITKTNARTHEIIRQYMDQSPIFQQRADLMGPRYCPSIEQKVDRFPEKDQHQIFIEPEGLNAQEVYPNGISTSLPFEAQVQFIQTIEGFEKAMITRPGYAISYGYFDPRGLTRALETKNISHLFFAGQINGTTGYEEAAAQGIMAGINAVRKINGLDPWYLERSQGYIGVLIDDLVTNGTIEPYRMFTSRAEYRLVLRCDNAHYRLTEKGYQLGVVSEKRYQNYQQALKKKEKATHFLLSQTIKDHPALLQDHPTLAHKRLTDWAKQPSSSVEDLIRHAIINPQQKIA